MTTPRVKLGPHKPQPVPPAATLMTAKQLRERYGNRSKMWLGRRIESDPTFPRPVYIGRYRFFKVEEVEAYDASLSGQRAA
jgi:hypothetical protein